MLSILFPNKCVLCKRILPQDQTDLCRDCRSQAPEFIRRKSNIPFIAHWTALWYYKDDVRKSIHRFKFGNRRNYAQSYARLLALKIDQSSDMAFDLLTWVPVSPLRKLKRGYDQSALLAKWLGLELGTPGVKLLKKARHTAPQSGIRESAERRANILGAYQVTDPGAIAGKRILLVDDVVTTGATASECAKILLTAGAKEVVFAAVAAAQTDKK